MHGALVNAWGKAPEYGVLPDLPAPSPTQIRLKVLGAAVHRLVQGRAAGKHFSATKVPVDPSADGVGIDEATGDIYYIPVFSGALFADYVNVEKVRLTATKLPKSVDPVAVAALVNGVSSAWMSLSERVGKDLPKDFSVAILGATGTAGRAAVSVARRFGAGRVVGVARSAAKLAEVEGLDGRVVLADQPEKTDFSGLGGQIDVVLDYVYGPAATALLWALKTERETRYVGMGMLGGDDFNVPGGLLRSKMLTITGAAPGSWTLQALGREMPAILAHVSTMPRPDEVVMHQLSDIERVWDTEEAKAKRIVFVP